ncbi:MAG: heat-inducible transcription repressor HrcA [Clostridiales bacterium]|mgnify:CR=1 FL=1|nr:heat-inducible transcription repressor HrcA [Clostridiales bacterium]
MKLDQRKLNILQAIIDDYIISAEPVGSRTIAKKYNLGISSATIRNEMADLEEMGYLEQPHTSAGRIPSDKGYRLYVDCLMTTRVLSLPQANYIKELYKKSTNQIEQIIFQTSRILSTITNYTAVVLEPKLNEVLIKHIQLVPIDRRCALLVVVTNTGIARDTIIRISEGVDSDYLYRISNMLNQLYKDKSLDDISLEPLINMQKNVAKNREFFNSLIDALTVSIDIEDAREVYLGGTSNIFNYPEYQDIIKAKEFLDLMEQKDLLYRLLIGSRGNGVSVTIGQENEYKELQDYSVITATYNAGSQPLGILGIIGPTRMEYSKAISVMDFMGETLSQYLTRLFAKE